MTATAMTVICSCGNFPTSIGGKLRTREGLRCVETISCLTGRVREDKARHAALIEAARAKRQAAEKAEKDAREAAEAAVRRKAEKNKRRLANKLARAEENRSRANGDHLKATRKVSK